MDNKDTTAGTAGDVLDFRTDGKVYTNVQGIKDTTTYSVPTDTQVIINGQAFDIKVLTNNQFTLYSKITSGVDYSEETDNLKR